MVAPDTNSSSPAIKSPAVTHIKWAWWAMGDGYVQTARKHALLGIRLSPTNINGWKALVCQLEVINISNTPFVVMAQLERVNCILRLKNIPL